MDRLISAAVSRALAEKKRPEPIVYVEDDNDDDEVQDGDYLGPEEHRLLRRRRQRHRRRQRERRMRRLMASGLRPPQVRAMEETVRRSERILRRRLPPLPVPIDKGDVIGVFGVMSGALVAGWIGWTLLLVGAVILMCTARQIIFLDNRRRCGEEKRADAEKKQAGVRAAVERTGNADLLPLQDW